MRPVGDEKQLQLRAKIARGTMIERYTEYTATKVYICFGFATDLYFYAGKKTGRLP